MGNIYMCDNLVTMFMKEFLTFKRDHTSYKDVNIVRSTVLQTYFIVF